jgi:hypothetical protein
MLRSRPHPASSNTRTSQAAANARLTGCYPLIFALKATA